MKKKTTKKKETVLSVLQDIRALLKASNTFLAEKAIKKEIVPIIPGAESKNYIEVTFPSMTAKEIMDSCDNKIVGGKLLWNTDWYNNEDFFTKEKTRAGKRFISKELLHGKKSWNECNDLKGDMEMLNMAEVVYLLKESEEFRKILSSSNYVRYTWTSSRDSDGKLVLVGDFDGEGVYVGRRTPDNRYVILGVSFSRSEKM